jgi:hypothetical protein
LWKGTKLYPVHAHAWRKLWHEYSTAADIFSPL